MSQTDNYDREDLTLRSDFQHGDNHLPASGQARSDTLKGIITFIYFQQFRSSVNERKPSSNIRQTYPCRAGHTALSMQCVAYPNLNP